MGPDFKHVPYFIIHCDLLSVIRINVDFREKNERWFQTPFPLAYSLYVYINVDNCERPLYNCVWVSECVRGHFGFCSAHFEPANARNRVRLLSQVMMNG